MASILFSVPEFTNYTRYKPEEVVRQRQQELWEEYKEIKERVERRKVLLKSEQRRQEQMARECKRVLESPHVAEEEKALAMRRMLHDPFKDMDEFLNPDEREELEELKFKSEESSFPALALSVARCGASQF